MANGTESSDSTQRVLEKYRLAVAEAVLGTLGDEFIWQLAHDTLECGAIKAAKSPNGGECDLGIRIVDSVLQENGYKPLVYAANQPPAEWRPPKGDAYDRGSAVAATTTPMPSVMNPAAHLELLQKQGAFGPMLSMMPGGTLMPPMTHTPLAQLISGQNPFEVKQCLSLAEVVTLDMRMPGYPELPCVKPQGSSNPCSSLSIDPEEATATTLILRNLPETYDQAKTQSFIEDKGYGGKYDFFLWFPAKQTSRLNSCGYSFVNFRDCATALSFRKEQHLCKIVDPDYNESPTTLSIAVANVQGFVPNYQRYQHLLDGVLPTRCAPYFAADSMAKLTADQITEAKRAAADNPNSAMTSPPPDGCFTTVIVRNLPPAVETQELCQKWLDQQGFDGTYDFLLFLPAKRTRRKTSEANGFGYCFVNFLAAQDASRCFSTLHEKSLYQGDPELNVVAARVQGRLECLGHFESLQDSGRCKPFIKSDDDADGFTPMMTLAVDDRPPGLSSYQ